MFYCLEFVELMFTNHKQILMNMENMKYDEKY